ncbi:MAG: ligand-binding sensor domain-containing protein, partial [Pseudohongiellaceae bacterium]
MRSQICIKQIRAVLLVTLACQLSFSLASDGPNRNFEHITTQDGLSSGLVTAIVQDPAGFLWIGTQSGLNRYDGSGIHKYYARDQDPSSLSHNAIWSLAIDSQNRMWVGSRGGLDLYLPIQDSFLRTDVSAEVRAILEIEIGVLWLGTSDGLFQY